MRNCKTSFLCIAFTMFALWGCKESNVRQLMDSGDKAPGKITNVEVVNRHGAAKITYTLPKSKSLLYIEAEYTIRTGVKREKKSSYYQDSVIVDGFSESKDYTVKLTAVSRGGNASEPVNIVIHPLEPPYLQAFHSVKMEPAFGGVHLNFANHYKGNIAITVLMLDSLGTLDPLQTFYTDQDTGSFYIRGLENKKMKFGVYVRDEYQNISDTSFVFLTPFLEEELDKTKFSAYKLPTDTWEGFGKSVISNLWDGKIYGSGVNDESIIFNTIQTGLPQWYTIDLGQKAVLSRIAIAGRPHYASYNRSFPKKFELWGSADPNTDGSFDSSWFKFGTFVTVPPSGKNPPTTNDIEKPTLPGESFTMPDPGSHPAIRYIRIRCLTNWGDLPSFQLGEITLYGQIVN